MFACEFLAAQATALTVFVIAGNTLLLPLAYYVAERIHRTFTGWRQIEV